MPFHHLYNLIKRSQIKIKLLERHAEICSILSGREIRHFPD